MSVQINMDKARRIHMDNIRLVRDQELVIRDVAFIRALESGDQAAQEAIRREKQVLRDIPQTFDLTAPSLARLREKWPAELPPRSG